jgi:uncharacterized protein (DUF2147 family)
MLSLFFGVFCTFISIVVNAAEVLQQTPIGYWKTVDEVTGKPKSIVQIWKTNENVLMGRVIKVFAKDTGRASPVCTKCSGDFFNQPIVGMVIISGLKAKEKQWINGEILDPENGKKYSCNLRTLENGKRLQVRGYVGLPLLGRSQTWERVDLMSG